MKVTVAAGGRFHALHLAAQLSQRNSLEKLITFSYTSTDKQVIPENLVAQSKLCKFIDQSYCRLRLGRIIQPSTLNVFKDNLFDRFIAKQLQSSKPFDLFVGWAHYVLKSIPLIKKKAGHLIIESGSCHILEQQEILQKAYKELGLLYPPIHPANAYKMVKEYELADYIVTPSSFARASFIKHGVPAEKMIVVPCGVDTQFFRVENKLEPAKFTVIFVGLLSVRKGVHHLLEAWQKLALPESEAQLILVGSLQKDLYQILPNYKLASNVIINGPTDKHSLKKLYSQSSVLVLPSLEDGFGMVIGEAMASGLPVITTTHCAGPDLIEPGKNGFVVPAANSNSLAEKISWCYHNRAATDEMGKFAQQKSSLLSWDIYGNTIYKVYQKIVGEE